MRYSSLTPADTEGWLRVETGGSSGIPTTLALGSNAPVQPVALTAPGPSSTASVAAGAANVVLRGHRLKQRRYFRLRGAVLQCTRDARQPGVALWSVCIREARVSLGTRPHEVVVATVSNPHASSTAVASGCITVALFATDEDERCRWAYALRKAAMAMSTRLEDYYRVGPVIGEGMNGQVREAHDLVTGEKVAVKMVPRLGRDHEDDLLAREVQIVLSLEHPNIVRTIDVFVRKRRVYFVMEFVPGGELFDHISDNKNFNEFHSACVMKDLLRALTYLHERGIVHRDVKLENLLCSTAAPADRPLSIKLADFGFSNFIPTDDGTFQDRSCDTALTSFVGTPYYIAPEMISAPGHGRPVDMWAAGVTLYILLSGKFPFGGATEKEYYARVIARPVYFPDTEWKTVSPSAKALVRGLLTKDPSARLTAGEALSHEWFRSFATEPAVAQTKSFPGPSRLHLHTSIAALVKEKDREKDTEKSSVSRNASDSRIAPLASSPRTSRTPMSNSGFIGDTTYSRSSGHRFRASRIRTNGKRRATITSHSDARGAAGQARILLAENHTALNTGSTTPKTATLGSRPSPPVDGTPARSNRTQPQTKRDAIPPCMSYTDAHDRSAPVLPRVKSSTGVSRATSRAPQRAGSELAHCEGLERLDTSQLHNLKAIPVEPPPNITADITSPQAGKQEPLRKSAEGNAHLFTLPSDAAPPPERQTSLANASSPVCDATDATTAPEQATGAVLDPPSSDDPYETTPPKSAVRDDDALTPRARAAHEDRPEKVPKASPGRARIAALVRTVSSADPTVADRTDVGVGFAGVDSNEEGASEHTPTTPVGRGPQATGDGPSGPGYSRIRRRPSVIGQLLAPIRLSLDGSTSVRVREQRGDREEFEGRSYSSGQADKDDEKPSPRPEECRSPTFDHTDGSGPALGRKRHTDRFPKLGNRFHVRSFHRGVSLDEQSTPEQFAPNMDRLPPKLAREQQRLAAQQRPPAKRRWAMFSRKKDQRAAASETQPVQSAPVPDVAIAWPERNGRSLFKTSLYETCPSVAKSAPNDHAGRSQPLQGFPSAAQATMRGGNDTQSTKTVDPAISAVPMPAGVSRPALPHGGTGTFSSRSHKARAYGPSLSWKLGTSLASREPSHDTFGAAVHMPHTELRGASFDYQLSSSPLSECETDCSVEGDSDLRHFGWDTSLCQALD